MINVDDSSHAVNANNDFVQNVTACMPFGMTASCVAYTLTTVPFLLLNILHIVQEAVTHDRT